MSKFWKTATLIGVALTGIIWIILIINSLGEPFLQDCFALGEGRYCADYRFTSFGKTIAIGAFMVPITTIGIFIIGKIKKLEAEATPEAQKATTKA